ncbi:MAG: hypothetical protein M3Y04_06120, partial [Actinomycetota bacterium]|nr:hypothetical protein [Actinomycetota bacterium]
MDDTGEVMCARHPQTPSRLTCVECETPICPDCAIRTPVGFKCPDHAWKAPQHRRSRTATAIVVVVVLGLVAFAQFARRTSATHTAAPACPTQPAPDVGIGTAGRGTRWSELAPSKLCGRYDAAVTWTGRDMLVWGGVSCAGAECPSDRAPRLGDGAAYNVADNAWRSLPVSPLTPRAPTAVAWTGREMLVWGGSDRDGLKADGAAYDPTRRSWRRLAGTSLAPRTGAASVWTGREMIVWGGSDLADGAAYDPATDRWRPMAPAPLGGRAAVAVVWTGREMIVWGGVNPATAQESADGAAY